MALPQHKPGTGPDAYLRDTIAGSMRHVDDISQLLQASAQRWTDALLSEVRAHLSGCLNVVEVAIGLQMDGSWLAPSIEALGPGYCRLAIERHPSVLSPVLLDHLRLRAAAAVVLRMGLTAPVFPAAEKEVAEPLGLPPALAEAVSALRLSVDGWFAPHPLDRPMRADLSAEPFCDLIWGATALLVDGLAARMGVNMGTAIPVLARVAEIIIARHDEQASPMARAAYVSTLVRDRELAHILAEQAVMRRDMLLLAAAGSARASIAVEQALALLVDGDIEDRAALMRLLDMGEETYVALLDALAPVRDAIDDDLLPEIAENYRLLTEDEAIYRLSRWRGPAVLVTKLARMGWPHQ